MSEKIKEYAIYPGQIKLNNEIFFGLDYKLTDFYNELAEENKQLKSQLQQKENIIKGLDNTIENLEEVVEQEKNIIKEVREYCIEVIKEHENGDYNVSTTQLAIEEHKKNIQNVLEILDKEVN